MSGLPFYSKLTDVANAAGLTARTIYGGVTRKAHILETVGCGVAFFDYDNDGWLDILVLGGTRFDEQVAGAGNRLYKNNRDGTFSDVTEKAGLNRIGWAGGVTIGDYNNDGYEDLFICYYGQNVLYRNNGDGTFTDVTQEAGLILPKSEWSTGCAFVDYDRDGHLDLCFSTYLEFDRDRVPRAGANPACNWKGILVHCGPMGLPRGRCYLFHNDGRGHFTDVSGKAGIAKARGYGLTVAAADFDNDGWPDIYVACDSTPSLYFSNRHDGTFSEEAMEYGVALNDDGQEQAGMGLAIGDFKPDGNLDILKTHFADDNNVLYQNEKGRGFRDVTLRAGLGVETRYVCWGVGIVDLDNDGLPDLFMVTGNVYPEIEAQLPQYPLKTPRLVFRNLGDGTFEELFEEAGGAILQPHASRGCAFGDFDNDGDVDILILNMNEPPSLLRNDVTGGGHWLKVQLLGVKANRSAIGARVSVRYGARVQAQEVLSQSSFLSCSDKRIHFGLGTADRADIDIRWPGGERESFRGVRADHLVVIQEGTGILKQLTPPFST